MSRKKCFFCKIHQNLTRSFNRFRYSGQLKGLYCIKKYTAGTVYGIREELGGRKEERVSGLAEPGNPSDPEVFFFLTPLSSFLSENKPL
jgi:hypothetical protein